MGQQAQETRQVIVGGLKVDPQHLFTGRQAVVTVLLQQGGLTEPCCRANKDQPGGVTLGHLLQQTRTLQVTVGGFRAGIFGGGSGGGNPVMCFWHCKHSTGVPCSRCGWRRGSNYYSAISAFCHAPSISGDCTRQWYDRHPGGGVRLLGTTALH
ncbi:hypothetical protein D3C78_948560 [compost metagenome]